MEAIEQETYKGFTISIHQDEEPESPREWDNLGKMVCFHKRYDLGDKHNLSPNDFNGWDEVERHLTREEDAVVILPLYLYDHSGLRMKVGSFHGLLPQGHAEFDSGCIGFIYVDRDTLRKEYGGKRITKSILQTATKVLEGEVATYDKFLAGDVYGYIVEDADGEQFDSCWGYYDDASDIVAGCKAIVDHHIEAENKRKHYPSVEVFVTKTLKFRAKIRESIELPSYEVTIGGESWQAGKGRGHEARIEEKMAHILTCLGNEAIRITIANKCNRDDCQADKDYCCDCFCGNLYKSPDQPDPREDR
jgi:hypothetical protein